MTEPGELTLDQKMIMRTIEAGVAHDLVTPQTLTSDEEKLLDKLDQTPPAPVGQENEAFERFLQQREPDRKP